MEPHCEVILNPAGGKGFGGIWGQEITAIL